MFNPGKLFALKRTFSTLEFVDVIDSFADLKAGNKYFQKNTFSTEFIDDTAPQQT